MEFCKSSKVEASSFAKLAASIGTIRLVAHLRLGDFSVKMRQCSFERVVNRDREAIASERCEGLLPPPFTTDVVSLRLASLVGGVQVWCRA